MNQQIVISRVLAIRDPQLYRQYQEESTAMLIDTRHIPEIFATVQDLYPELDRTDTNIMFVACVYDFYCPASFMGSKVQKLPVGIRDVAANVLGYENPENVNGWKDKAGAYLKGGRYREKVNVIKEQFKQFSVRKEDWTLGI